MFGYIQPEKSELRIKEYDMYKTVYCSLCKNLGKNYGLFARATLSYDFTFLSLLILSLSDECEKINHGKCVYNPLKKCNFLKNTNKLDFVSATASILLYYKILDNIKDENGLKKIFYKILLLIHKKYFKKAQNKYPKIASVALEYINEQTIIENEKCNNIDKAAEPTAVMLGKIFETLNKKESRALYRLGYCMGKWIYLTDALADIEQDYKKGRYNPLLDGGNTKIYANNRLSSVLNFCQSEAAKAFELLNIYKYKNILGNIIYLGLDSSRNKLLKEKK